MKNLLVFLLLMGTANSAYAITYKNLKCRYSDQEQLGDEGEYYVQIDGTLEIINENIAILNGQATTAYLNAKPVNGKVLIQDLVAGVSKIENKANTPGYKGNIYNNHYRFFAFGQHSDFNGSLIIEKTPKISEAKSPFGHRRKFYSFDAALDVTYGDHHGDYVKMTCTAQYK